MFEFEFLVRRDGRASVCAVHAKTTMKAYRLLADACPGYDEAHVVTIIDPRFRLVCVARPGRMA